MQSSSSDYDSQTSATRARAVSRPSEPEPFLFSLVVTAYVRVSPMWLQRAISAFFFTLSPDVPVDIRDFFKDTQRQRIAIYSAVAAFFFCFIVTAVLCAIEGTLYGNEQGRLYFLEDWWNIVLYVVICPAYVCTGVCIIITTIQHWSHTNEFARQLAGAGPSPPAGGRFGLALTAILLTCGLAMSSYMYDSLNSATVQTLYWFMEEGGAVRALNRVGFYYIALNFGLLFITALAVFCFFSLAMDAMWAGKSLTAGGVREFRVLRDKLTAFTQVYLMTKAIAALYMINTIIWKDSPLGGGGATVNIVVAGGLLTLIGVFFIAVPRLYVELKWFEYKLMAATDPDSEPSFDDLRPRGVRLGSHLIDVLVIGAFVSAFWGIDLNPLDWLRSRQ